MTDHIGATTGSTIIGDYVDEAERPPDGASARG
jgi:hypothetical protein